jgi:exopolysaccharide production protein ExoZ
VIAGDASYTLYLSHYFVLVAIGRFWSTALPIDSVLVHAAVIVSALLIVGLVASLGYVYVERPILRLMKSLRSPTRVAPT